MASLRIDELEPDLLARLQDRAAVHGRSVEDEAKVVLETALRTSEKSTWVSIAAIRERLNASGRTFGDSAELIREDRNR